MRRIDRIMSIRIAVSCLFVFGGMMIGISQAQVPSQGLQLTIDTALKISRGHQNLLTYQFRLVSPPLGQDSSYQRSGFIHPIYTLQGQRLTHIQPPDHYHHYGIWNPWTHTLFEQDTVDFWNLAKKSGTVRFMELIDHKETPQYASYTALHHHVVFKGDSSEKVALKEWQTITVHLSEEAKDLYWVDITIALRCAGPSPVRLLTYRYGGGLAWRATEFWNSTNSTVLTSEGKSRDDTDGSRARWCLVHGELPDGGYGGMAILSHPGNYNYPEPLRMWDSTANQGRSNVFLNFSPTRDRDWLLEPGQIYLLKYRLIVFDGKQDAGAIDRYWHQFASESITQPSASMQNY